MASKDMLPKRRVSRNPFAGRGGKENFPNFDTLFGSKEAEQSFVSHEGSSILNMSIGARAALNEHLRHVEKFGIDGEQQDVLDQSPPLKNSLDAQWDRLLDNSRADISGSFAAVSSYPRLDILVNTSRVEESIEVMTDVSNHDYFNSSRVKVLSTPERNLDRPDMLTLRSEEQEQCLFEDESDFEPGNDQFAPELRRESHNSAGRDSVFHSFCAAELSRISNSDSEARGLHVDHDADLSRMSNVGLDIYSPQDNSSRLEDEAGAFSPIMKEMTSPSKVHDSSFSSTPKRSPQSFDLNLEWKLPTKLSSTVKRRLLRPRERSGNHCHPFCSDLSPLGNEGRSPPVRDNFPPIARARTIGQEETSDIAALDTMPADFLKSLESNQLDALSPISQHKSQGGAVILQRSWQKETDQSYASSSSASLSGRKRYRTVVPRRVYVDSPSQFPDEYDSFSRPSGSGTDKSFDSTQRSLLTSFDAVS